MEAVVSDILRDRMQEPGGLKLTAVLSIAAHACAIAAIAIIPGVLPRSNTAPPIVMTISLGGTPGPVSGGLTMLGGRNIVAARPSLAPKLDRMVLPSPKAEPAMVLPVPDPRLKPKAPPKPAAASKDPAGTNVGRGFETQKGSTNVETGARGMGFGLSSGGGGGTGGYLDVKNFCCPEYLQEMIARITRSWQQQQSTTGTVRMKFTVQRSGQLTDIQVEESSNVSALDLASERALRLTDHLQPLPSAFPEDRLPVHLFFEYTRK